MKQKKAFKVVYRSVRSLSLETIAKELRAKLEEMDIEIRPKTDPLTVIVLLDTEVDFSKNLEKIEYLEYVLHLKTTE